MTYSFDPANPMRLTRIASSDGRQITLSYNTQGRVATVSDGSRTWVYTYATGVASSSA